MANYPHGNYGFGSTGQPPAQLGFVGNDQRPTQLGFAPAQSIGFELPNAPRSRSPSYMVYTPGFISFKVTNLPHVYRFTMARAEISEKAIRKNIKKATKIKGKTLLKRDASGSIVRIDTDLMLQYHIEQMEARQRREGTSSEMELLIGDKHGSILQFHTEGWVQM